MKMQITQKTPDSWCARAKAAKRVKSLRRGLAPGSTLTEAMVSMVIVAIVATGGLSYEYLAAKHSLIARAQTTATRTAQLLLEDWKSTGGSTEYDPSSLGLGFSSAARPAGGSVMPFESGSTLGGVAYSIQVDGLPMLVALEYDNVAYDAEAEVTLRQLAVITSFAETPDAATQAEPWMGGIRPVILTTYARVDAAGG